MTLRDKLKEKLHHGILGFLGDETATLLQEFDVWEMIDPYDEKVIDMEERALELLSDGAIDPRALMELSQFFDFHTKQLMQRFSFGKDQAGRSVNASYLYGEMKNVRPEYVYYLYGKMIIYMLGLKTENLHLKKQLGQNVNFEGMHIVGS